MNKTLHSFMFSVNMEKCSASYGITADCQYCIVICSLYTVRCSPSDLRKVGVFVFFLSRKLKKIGPAFEEDSFMSSAVLGDG